QSRLANPTISDGARVFLGYALAKDLDDLQRFDEAFHWFSAAASTRRRHLAYDVAVDERKLDRIIEVFPPQALKDAPRARDSSRYIFIVGLPRSGTTLLEHILTGLPGVQSHGETESFMRALMSAVPSGPGDIFARAAAADADAVAANYGRFTDDISGGDKIIEK